MASGAVAGASFHAMAHPWTVALEETIAKTTAVTTAPSAATAATATGTATACASTSTTSFVSASSPLLSSPVNHLRYPSFSAVLGTVKKMGYFGSLFRGSGLKVCVAQVGVGAATFAVYDVAMAATAALRSTLEIKEKGGGSGGGGDGGGGNLNLN